MNEPTPETDALLEPLRGSCAFNGPCAEHARRLERERDLARAETSRALDLLRVANQTTAVLDRKIIKLEADAGQQNTQS